MAPLPPWLTISPADFLKAAQAGAALGQQIGQAANEASIARERIAASERENAARVSAQSAMSSRRAAQDAAQAQAVQAVRDWEMRQRLGMEQERLAMSQDDLAHRQALAMENLSLDKSKMSLDEQKQADAMRKYEEEKLSPVYRTVENQLVKVDPTSGTATSLFTAPYRPTATSALDRLLAGGVTSTATNAQSAGLPPKPGERIPVISPSGKRGTVSAEKLDEALANGYKRL